jgi:membrane-associated phospholipid phosphatase
MRETKYLGPLAMLFLALVAPLAIFGKIADEVREGSTLKHDDAILHALYQHSSAGFDRFFIEVSRWGGFYGLFPLTVFLIGFYFVMKRRGDAYFVLVSVGGASLINLLAKRIFGRDRPALWLSPAPETDFSFPSGHAMLSTAVFASIIVLAWNTKARIPVLTLGIFCILLVSFSRLYLGVHYPTDVVAGICASTAWVGGVTWLARSPYGYLWIRERMQKLRGTTKVNG